MVSIRTLTFCTIFAILIASSSASEGQEDEPDIIRIVSIFRTLTLDPIKSVFTGSIETFGQLYSRLLRRNLDGELEPALALRWEISEDGLDYTFHLRDARFSDGSPLTADDVAFTLLRMRDHPEAAYAAAVMEVQDAWAEDDHTLRVHFSEPNSPFLESLEMCFLGVVSRKDVEQRGDVDAFADNPVTSGPYRVAEWRRNDRLILEPNPYYWREGYPLNDGAELIEVVDTNTRIAMLRAGEADAVRLINLSSVAELSANPLFEVPEEPATRIDIVLLNHARPPFNDQRVREAAALALDMDRITAVATRGRAKRANALIPYQLNYYDADFPLWEYNPVRASELIQDANAAGSEVVINITAPDADWEMMALILQSYWNEIGLDVKIQKMDQALYEQRLMDGDYDASIEWWYNETADPDLAVKWALCGSCGNRSYYTNYSNDRLDQLTRQGTVELDAEKRGVIYREILQIAFADVAQIPLYYRPWLNAYSTGIEGLHLTPSTQWTLEEAHHTD